MQHTLFAFYVALYVQARVARVRLSSKSKVKSIYNTRAQRMPCMDVKSIRSHATLCTCQKQVVKATTMHMHMSNVGFVRTNIVLKSLIKIMINDIENT